MSEPFLIFLSYDKGSEPEVMRLKEELERRVHLRVDRGTFHLFRDNDDIKPGDPFEQTLTEALGRAVVLLVFVTDSIIRRDWCVREIQLVADRQKAGDPVRIVPVLLQEDGDIFPDSNISKAEFTRRDDRYFSELTDQQKSVVGILRSLHLFNGLVFVESRPEDGAYTEAADDLAERFIEISRDPAVRSWHEAHVREIDEGQDPAIKNSGQEGRSGVRRPLLAGAAAIVLAAGLAFWGWDRDIEGGNGGPDPNPEPQLTWSELGNGATLYNETGAILEAYYGIAADASVAEQISVGAERPERDAPSGLETAIINQDTWYRYRDANDNWYYIRKRDGVRLAQ